MPASWGIVPNYALSRTGGESLPAFIPGLSTLAPGGTRLRIDADSSLVISGEDLDTVRAFCLAHSAVAFSTINGRLPNLFVTGPDDLITRIVVGYRPDLAQRQISLGSFGQVGMAAAL